MRKGFLEKAAAASADNIRQWKKRFGPVPEPIPGPRQLFLPGDSGCSVIAEVKMASPSAGDMMGSSDPLQLAAAYQAAGAAAISVVVEEQHFGGSPELFSGIRQCTELPLLWKDFVIDPYQVALAAALGASAVLLIAGMLPGDDLSAMVLLAKNAGLRPLVEVHDEKELERSLDCGTDLVGVNNRDLESLQVSLDVSTQLVQLLPERITAVSESGIKDAKTVQVMKELGYGAVLVGEALVTAPDTIGKLTSMVQAGR